MEHDNRDPSAVEDEPEPLDTYLLTVDTAEDRYILFIETADGGQLLPTWRRDSVPAYLTMATILHEELCVAATWLPNNVETTVIGGSESGGWVVQVALQADELPKFDAGARVGVWIPWADFIEEYDQTYDLIQ